MVVTGRRVVALVLGLVAVIAAGCGAGSTEQSGTSSAEQAGGLPCADGNQRNCAAAVGDLLDVTLNELHPTQPSLGYGEVFYRLGRYTMGPDPADQLFDAWCAANGQEGLQSAEPGANLADPASFTCTVPLARKPRK